MNYQPLGSLFAPAAVARNQESSRCVLLVKKTLVYPRAPADERLFSSDDYELVVRQEPVAAKVFIGKEKGMKTLGVDYFASLTLGQTESL
jgi:hypothetical protein